MSGKHHPLTLSRSFVQHVVLSTTTRAGRRFDLFIQALIIVSLIDGALESLPNLPPVLAQTLEYIETLIVVIFTAEYLLRFYGATHRVRYLFSLPSIIDLLAIVPFYITTGLDLRAVRSFRLFRLFRILKFTRYSRVMLRFREAFRLAREELVLFLLSSGFLLYLASTGIYYFEREQQPDVFASIPHAMWWAVATLTTVGYGDVYPVTPGGKIFTSIILFLGLGIVAVPSGIIATALGEARDNLQKENSAEQNEPQD